MSEQSLLDALHAIQLWGIVGPSRDPSRGKGRCGSNDEFLEAYGTLEDEVKCLISENERLKRENAMMHELVAEMLREHTRIYHTGGVLRAGPSATSKQMAHWYDKCTHSGIEVD